ncbi:ribonuclease H-like [Ambystoma mexicanum]|uniref:ribonuclease H-like n=1 Tax=Ambystoma mexicanum TaxID=8296 RepID=UPI0037E737A8
MEAYLTSPRKVYEEDTCQGIPTVYVDGCSCHVDSNGGKELVAGIGNDWVNDTPDPSAGYKIGLRSSQVAELMAVYQAILTAVHHKLKELVIITDSDYVRNGFVEHLINWKNRGIFCANNKPLKHSKLIQSIGDLVTINEMTIYWKKIRGHSKREAPDKTGNDLTDQLAKTRALQWDFIETEFLLNEIYMAAVTRS